MQLGFQKFSKEKISCTEICISQNCVIEYQLMIEIAGLFSQQQKPAMRSFVYLPNRLTTCQTSLEID